MLDRDINEAKDSRYNDGIIFTVFSTNIFTVYHRVKDWLKGDRSFVRPPDKEADDVVLRAIREMEENDD